MTGAAAPSVWEHFADFVRWERAVGGPDPHMALVGKLSENEEWLERVWRAGCYIGVYNVPVAQALWQELSWKDVVAHSADALRDWLTENWEGIVTRRERRSVRTPAQLGRFLQEYAEWAYELHRRPWLDPGYASPAARYELAWDDCQRVYALGRYVALKLLEFLRRYCEAPLELPDLRARGGWSPRAGLALLFPSHSASLNGDDRLPNLRLADSLADETRLRLDWDYGLPLDRYNLQVLLCDFKQSLVGRRQYPGRSHDSELVYHAKVAGHWGLDRSMFDARLFLFPGVALGELQGWTDVREELGHVLSEHGYTWSDLLYDYALSRDDLAHPVAAAWAPA